MKIQTILDVILNQYVKPRSYRRLRGAYCLHLQVGQKSVTESSGVAAWGPYISEWCKMKKFTRTRLVYLP